MFICSRLAVYLPIFLFTIRLRKHIFLSLSLSLFGLLSQCFHFISLCHLFFCQLSQHFHLISANNKRVRGKEFLFWVRFWPFDFAMHAWRNHIMHICWSDVRDNTLFHIDWKQNSMSHMLSWFYHWKTDGYSMFDMYFIAWIACWMPNFSHMTWFGWTGKVGSKNLSGNLRIFFLHLTNRMHSFGHSLPAFS